MAINKQKGNSDLGGKKILPIARKNKLKPKPNADWTNVAKIIIKTNSILSDIPTHPTK